MKTKSFLLSAFAVIMLAGCSDDAQEDKGIPGDALVGKAYLSLSLQSHATGSSTRANAETQPGSSAESSVTNVTVLLFDKDDICLDVVDFTGTIVGNHEGDSKPEAQASDAKLVPEKTKKVFVVINPYASGWDLSEDAVVGKLWSAINTTVDVVIANVADDGDFMMASAGTSNKGALTEVDVYKPATYTPADILQAQTDAKTNAKTINIDRLSAKVQVSVLSPGFTTKPTGASFTFNGWELSVTNKSVKLYSDLITYDNATPGAVYRRDKNYLVSEQPTNEATRNAAFNYLKNINSTAETMPDVAQIDGASQYCLENTMDAGAQQLGFTTKVVVKAHYSPKNITENTSYFSWMGAYYTLAELKEEYKKHANNSGLKVDLPIFLKKAKLMAEDVTDQSTIDAAVEALKDGDFNAKTGIIGRFCAVRYYHESVCYYDVLIRHDQAITTKMALGRYGVVRNNWYKIELQSVSGPGTPWIPDPSDPDPNNPTPPGTDDDEPDAYLSVKIVINPWTFWKQGADLH